MNQNRPIKRSTDDSDDEPLKSRQIKVKFFIIDLLADNLTLLYTAIIN